jgi:hypothetical protein
MLAGALVPCVPPPPAGDAVTLGKLLANMEQYQTLLCALAAHALAPPFAPANGRAASWMTGGGVAVCCDKYTQYNMFS